MSSDVVTENLSDVITEYKRLGHYLDQSFTQLMILELGESESLALAAGRGLLAASPMAEGITW